MYIPFQPTRGIRPSLSTREEVASEAETEIVPESENEESPGQVTMQTVPLRRSDRGRRPPLRYRDEDSLTSKGK